MIKHVKKSQRRCLREYWIHMSVTCDFEGGVS